MRKLAIIADDLTGALDAAAPFARAANGVVVATEPAQFGAAIRSGADVVAVSTRSREISAEAARQRVARVLTEVPDNWQIFKKIDSRLKGNLAAELEPFGQAPLLVCPAIPELGRRVMAGQLTGDGVAVPIDIRARLELAGARAAVPDAATLDDMAAAIVQAADRVVLVGARGLAQALAQVIGLAPAKPPPPPPVPFCIAVGSHDPITLRQVAELQRERPDLVVAKAPSGIFSAGETPNWTAVALLQATPGPDLPAQEVARNFARGAAGWLGAAHSMLLTGGATAEAILDALHISLLTVEGEVLPGMPYCQGGGKVIITKSGGFGEPGALAQLARRAEMQEA